MECRFDRISWDKYVIELHRMKMWLICIGWRCHLIETVNAKE